MNALEKIVNKSTKYFYAFAASCVLSIVCYILAKFVCGDGEIDKLVMLIISTVSCNLGMFFGGIYFGLCAAKKYILDSDDKLKED